MSFTAAINFRVTSGFVTDGGGETYCLMATDGSTRDAYPTSRGGLTFGYTFVDSGAGARNRESGNDPRLAGMHFNTDPTRASTFRLDLPATGDYTIRLAMGDPSYAVGTDIAAQILDNASGLATVTLTGGTTSGNKFGDAVAALYSNATWPGSNTAITLTFSSTILNLKMGKISGNALAYICHLFVDQVVGTKPLFRPVT